jgi:hypothetical protein
MEIEIITKCWSSERALTYMTKYYARKLKLQKSKFTLIVCTQSNLTKIEGVKGKAGKTDKREITIVIDSKLSKANMVSALAHEMVHVKQIAFGQLTGKVARNGQVVTYWCGKRVSVSYINRPWEIEAFARQKELVTQLYSSIIRKTIK